MRYAKYLTEMKEVIIVRMLEGDETLTNIWGLVFDLMAAGSTKSVVLFSTSIPPTVISYEPSIRSKFKVGVISIAALFGMGISRIGKSNSEVSNWFGILMSLIFSLAWLALAWFLLSQTQHICL